MSFQEAGKINSSKNDGPLNMNWSRLQEYMCPMCECEDLLTYFDHIELWKCGCGFKISKYKFEKITSDLDENDYVHGFCYGDYTDETPF